MLRWLFTLFATRKSHTTVTEYFALDRAFRERRSDRNYGQHVYGLMCKAGTGYMHMERCVELISNVIQISRSSSYLLPMLPDPPHIEEALKIAGTLRHPDGTIHPPERDCMFCKAADALEGFCKKERQDHANTEAA